MYVKYVKILVKLIFLFKLAWKQTKVPLKQNFNGKRLHPTNLVKYLSIKTDENFNWKHQIRYLAIKLNRENAILFKLRHLSPIEIVPFLFGHKISSIKTLKDYIFSKSLCSDHLFKVTKKRLSGKYLLHK